MNRLTRPRVQRSKCIVRIRYHAGKMLAEKIRILLESVLNTQEDHALFFQVFLDIVVDHFRVVLCPDACQVLLFRFR